MKGWTEGLQMMAPGETRRFWIPAEMAFGTNATETSKPVGPLVFDIELYSIERQPKPPLEPLDSPLHLAKALKKPCFEADGGAEGRVVHGERLGLPEAQGRHGHGRSDARLQRHGALQRLGL